MGGNLAGQGSGVSRAVAPDEGRLSADFEGFSQADQGSREGPLACPEGRALPSGGTLAKLCTELTRET